MKRKFNTDRLKLELRRARVPALQYLFLIACFAFAISIILKNQFYERPWVAKRDYKVEFTDVKGVNEGVQRVRLAGVDVGVVNKSEIDKKTGRPVLTLSWQKKFGKLYKDAKLRLRPLTPLQDMVVVVESRGHPAAGELKKGDILPGSQTISPVDISRVMNTFDTGTRDRLQGLLHELDKGLKDNGEQLNQSFAALAPFLQAAARTTHEMALRKKNLARVVTNLNLLTQALGQRDTQLSNLVLKGNSTLSRIAQAAGPFDSTLREIPPTLTQMRSSFASLRAAEDDLDPAFQSLRPVADRLQKGLDSLAEFGKDATPTLAALQTPVKQLRPLMSDLRPTARSLNRAFASLRPQAPEFNHILNEFDSCKTVVGKFFQQTLSVFKFYDSYGPFPRGEAIANGDIINVLGVGTSLTLKKIKSCTDGIS